MDIRRLGAWTVTIFVGATFLLSGASKIVQSTFWHQQFVNAWGLPAWMATVTGLAEIAGATLILAPRTAVFGGSIIAAVMIGATATHVVAGELERLPVTLTLAALATFVAWYRCPWCNSG